MKWDAGTDLELWVEGISASAEEEDGMVWLKYYTPYGGEVPGFGRIDFTVLDVDMDMDGVQDDRADPQTELRHVTHEIKPGGFIPLGEVRKIVLRRIQPADLTGNVTLSVDTNGDGNVRIWDNEQMQGDPISLPKTYQTPSGLPPELWVEGHQVSSGVRDITLVYEYTVAGKTFDDRINLTVGNLERIQYKIGSDGYQDCPIPPSSLVVAKGADVTFKAIKNPSWFQWPPGKPVWSGSSGASGTGEEVEVAFDDPSILPTDYKVVQAECGNTVSVNVFVVYLDLLEINEQRTSEPVESSFPIHDGWDHIELGSTFKYDLMLDTWPTPVKLDAEIWDLDLINEVIASGPGASISHNFGTGDHDDGTCKVRFYFDNNTSGDSYTGVNDPKVDSPSFEAQELTNHGLTFAKSSEVSGSLGAGSVCTDATDRIVKRDTANDFRATARLWVAGIEEVSATDNGDPPVTHDPVAVYESRWEVPPYNDISYFKGATNADVIVVSNIQVFDQYGFPLIFVDYAGIAYPDGRIFIQAQHGNFSGWTLAHEFGHICGLDDDEIHTDKIMYWECGHDGPRLSLSEIDNYE